jgi:hypothetical protein
MASSLELASECCHRVQMPAQFRANQSEVGHKRISGLFAG